MSKLKKVKDVLDAIGDTKAGQAVTKKVKEAGEFVGIGDKRKTVSAATTTETAPKRAPKTTPKPKETKSQTQTAKTPKITGKATTTSSKISAPTGDTKVKKPPKADLSEFQKKYAEARKKYKAGGATKFSFKGRQYSVATKSELEKAGGYGKVDSYLKSKQTKSKSSGGVIKKSVGGTVRGMGAATRGGSFRVR